MDEKKVTETIDQINKSMDMLINDSSVPKNVRSSVSQAKEKLNDSGDYTMRISGAIYEIDNVSGDINLPPQARTMVWNILSMLESIKD